MQLHPPKMSSTACHEQNEVAEDAYKMHGHTLETVNSAKYIGANVHKSLTWTQHISQITKRTNSTSASFRRNIHKCPQEIKAQFYITLVRPWLDYASVIWDPQTTENINKLEMVQRRSARMVMTNFRTSSSVSYMIRQLNSPLLQKRRAQARAFMINRVVYQLSMQHLQTIEVPEPEHL